MTFRTPRMGRLWLAAVLAAAWATPSKADPLDEVLRDNAEALVGRLAAKKYAAVGVLKFEVRTAPDAPVSLDAGRMNEAMATRLENALILALDAKNPQFGVVRGASRAAADLLAKQGKSATYETADGRRELFTQGYPLAWGGKTVTPDAFLVGRVSFESGMRKARVELSLFDAKTPEEVQPVPLEGAEVAVTRPMLADVNQPFVAADLIRKRGDLDLPDPAALVADGVVPAAPSKFVSGGDGRGKPTGPVGKVPPVGREPEAAPKGRLGAAGGWKAVEEVLDFQMYYDGVRQERTADGNFPPPKPGQEVYFTLQSTERVGVVLLVNGINTADYDRANRESDGYLKWVLKPGQKYQVRGYYTGAEVFPFQVVPKGEAARVLSALAPAAKHGLIELDLYREAAVPAAAQDVVLRDQDGTADTLADLQRKVRASIDATAKRGTRGVIVPGTAEKVKLDSVVFEGTLAAKLVVRYTPEGGER